MRKQIIFKILIAIIILLGAGYLGYSQFSFDQKIQNNLNSLSQKISDIETILLATQAKNTTLADALAAAKEKADTLDSQFKSVNKNVSTLEKITKTDPELLQKYSKIFFLNDNYAPADLTVIPSDYTFLKTKTYKLQDQVLSHLKDLMDDAKSDGVSLEIISAFRSFSDQAILKGAYTVNYGAGTANSFSADQGYSEHQLGTTVDFTNPTVADTFSGFAKSKEYTWLKANAWKYGFIISYPENNTYYQFEPWHWRFVGYKLAKDLHTKNKYFYDLTQREINTYLANFFD